MHPPQRKPIECFTAAAMQVVRELGSRGEIETYNYTQRDVNISNVRVPRSNIERSINSSRTVVNKLKHDIT